MSRKIPKKVRINRTTYQVKSVHSFKTCKLGEIDHNERQITLARNVRYGSAAIDKKVFRLSKEEQWETYWHEIVHGILRDMRRHDLNNERFVNAFCLRLYSVLKGAI